MQKRILVIDDSQTLRRILGGTLEDAGFEIYLAGSGDEGLHEAKAIRPQLILLDYQMPGMNGYQVISHLEQDNELHEIPVILMCTRSEQHAVADMAKGLTTLEKPFRPDVAVRVVEEVLAHEHGDARQITAPSLTLPPAEVTRSAEGLLTLPTDPEETVAVALSDSSSSAADAGDDVLLDLAAEAVLADIGQLLPSLLTVHGIDDVERITDIVIDDLRQRLNIAVLSEFARRALSEGELTGKPQLFGDLAHIPLPEVLQLLSMQGQSGVLEVVLDQARYAAWLDGGMLVAITGRNDIAALRLGRYFVIQGTVDRPTLNSVLATSSSLPLGARLLEEEHIDRAQLESAVHAQANDLMFEMLRAKRGVFSLQTGVSPSIPEPLRVSLPVSGILLEALRRMDEEKVIDTRVPTLSVWVQRLSEEADTDALSAEERFVLEAIPVDVAVGAESLLDPNAFTDGRLRTLLFRLQQLRLVRFVDAL